jgi:oxalate decarboxylase/phosphoglucose isomerase-like protein (cupin superfamily)
MTAKRGFFVDATDVDTFAFDWGQLSITCSPDVNDAQRFSAGLVELKQGLGHERHNHPGAEEIILVIEGTGEQMVEDETGAPIVQQVGPGTTIYVPESRYHATKNTGSGPMKLFVVYSPAGPEHALRELPDFRLVPAPK